MAEGGHHILCSICLEFVNPDEDKLLNLKTCGHVFHDCCIDMWFKSSSYDPDDPFTKKCPVCQTKCTEADVQPIYIHTKKAEQSDEIAKELQMVREQLKREKEKAAESGKSAMVSPMVQMVAKMRLIEAASNQRAVFMPNCRHVLFEGCTGLEDSVILKEYTGPRNWHHKRLRRCFQPELVMAHGLGRDTIHNSLMNTIFMQQMAVLKQSYDENKDGRLELTVKFGRLYIFKAPGPTEMLVRDFNYGIGIQHKKTDPKAVCTSFMPSETPSERIIRQLVESSFTEIAQEDVVIVSVEHSKQRPRILFEVHLTSDLRFRSLRQNDRSFVNIDIRRKDESKPDVRLAVKSVDEEYEKEKLEAPAKNYARDNLVRQDPQHLHRLLVDKSAIGKVSYVRKKVSKVYRLHKQPTVSLIGLEKYLDVKLINTTSFEEPQYNGTFKRMKQQVEVYVQISGKDELYKACDDPNFLQKLLEFCNKFA